MYLDRLTVPTVLRFPPSARISAFNVALVFFAAKKIKNANSSVSETTTRAASAALQLLCGLGDTISNLSEDTVPTVNSSVSNCDNIDKNTNSKDGKDYSNKGDDVNKNEPIIIKKKPPSSTDSVSKNDPIPVEYKASFLNDSVNNNNIPAIKSDYHVESSVNVYVETNDSVCKCVDNPSVSINVETSESVIKTTSTIDSPSSIFHVDRKESVINHVDDDQSSIVVIVG